MRWVPARHGPKIAKGAFNLLRWRVDLGTQGELIEQRCKIPVIGFLPDLAFCDRSNRDASVSKRLASGRREIENRGRMKPTHDIAPRNRGRSL